MCWYLLCFWSWATNAIALSDECDLKAPVCSVSSRSFCHPSEACEIRSWLLQGWCEFAIVVFTIGYCIYDDLWIYVSMYWKLSILSDKSLPCYKPWLKEVFFNNLNAVVIKPPYPCAIVCPSPLHSLWALSLLQPRWLTGIILILTPFRGIRETWLFTVMRVSWILQ